MPKHVLDGTTCWCGPVVEDYDTGVRAMGVSPIDEDPFQWMKPTEASVLVIEQLRVEFYELYRQVLKTVPHCRERSLAITNLEQAAQWAIKAAVGRIP